MEHRLGESEEHGSEPQRPPLREEHGEYVDGVADPRIDD